MSEHNLYPTFNIPDDTGGRPVDDTPAYLPAPLFDHQAGDFVRDGRNRIVMADGLETYKGWVEKSLQTQHGAALAYLDIGVDYEGAMSESEPSAVMAELERTITEGLLMHPMTERVRDFEFTWDNDTLTVSFTVQGRGLPAFDINMIVL